MKPMNNPINERFFSTSFGVRASGSPKVGRVSVHTRDLLNLRRLQVRLNSRQVPEAC